MRELLGPASKSLISGFGLFCLGNTGSNLGPETISLISEFLLYSGYTVINKEYLFKKYLFKNIFLKILPLKIYL